MYISFLSTIDAPTSIQIYNRYQELNSSLLFSAFSSIYFDRFDHLDISHASSLDRTIMLLSLLNRTQGSVWMEEELLLEHLNNT